MQADCSVLGLVTQTTGNEMTSVRSLLPPSDCSTTHGCGAVAWAPDGANLFIAWGAADLELVFFPHLARQAEGTDTAPEQPELPAVPQRRRLLLGIGSAPCAVALLPAVGIVVTLDRELALQGGGLQLGAAGASSVRLWPLP